jgi:hypothetical protein
VIKGPSIAGLSAKTSSRIPQEVFLTLIKHEPNLAARAQIHFNRPREVKQGHVFRVLVHIDAVEDLLFYQYLREDLIADEKIPWRNFSWHFGRLDGDLQDDDDQTVTMHCGRDFEPTRDYRDDDDGDRGAKRPRARSLIGRMSNWLESHTKNRDRQMRGRSREWHKRESSARRRRNSSPPPTRVSPPASERRAMRMLWQVSESEQQPGQWSNSDAIQIIPVDLGQYGQPHIAIPDEPSYSTSQETVVIVINTSANFDPQENEVATNLPVM